MTGWRGLGILGIWGVWGFGGGCLPCWGQGYVRQPALQSLLLYRLPFCTPPPRGFPRPSARPGPAALAGEYQWYLEVLATPGRLPPPGAAQWRPWKRAAGAAEGEVIRPPRWRSSWAVPAPRPPSRRSQEHVVELHGDTALADFESSRGSFR